MLELADFFGASSVDTCLALIEAAVPGLGVVAGADPRPWAPVGTFLPSGRAALFRILVRQLLDRDAKLRAILVTDARETARSLRPLRRRVQILEVQSPATYAEAISQAARQQPRLIIVDRLCAESVQVALHIAREGVWVVAQLDTVSRGSGVADLLVDLGASAQDLEGLRWVLAIQRLARLCPACRVRAPITLDQQTELRSRFASFELPDPNLLSHSKGCSSCRNTGRAGEISTFDFWLAGAGDPHGRPFPLSLEANLLGLAMQGLLSLDDVLAPDSQQLRNAAYLLHATERALDEARAALARKEAELDAANRVLQQRTEALVSLEGVGQALITSASLHELAQQLCRNARTLCGADRAILYFRRAGVAEILAVVGWDHAATRQTLDARELGSDLTPEPVPFDHWPPGVPQRPTDATSSALRAGLRVPLIAQGRRVGLMIVHTCQKHGFSPGEVALLQTFAHQAALAIQRAGLVEDLREKIVQLETAQVHLVQKERMEREMELARQVQQSVLPRTFPSVPGYSFAARNEPARQVGGDFYDVFPMGSESFGLVVGDVSDKGMPAALYMTRVHGLLRSEARRRLADGCSALPSPAEVLQAVHCLLLDLGGSDLFVTVFYGVVHAPTRRLTYARAGHDRPFLLREGHAIDMGGEGTVLGFPGLDDICLSVEEVALAPGDRLVLYTDGLTDAQGSEGVAFGLERLKSILQPHFASSPAELCERAFVCLASHQEHDSQYDDMTLLVMGVE